ncbi:hypothetical protein EJB05_45208, partial [Eragrostis curvula]
MRRGRDACDRSRRRAGDLVFFLLKTRPVTAFVAFTSMVAVEIPTTMVMAPLKIIEGCIQFANLSSTTNAGSHMTLRSQPQLLDPKECKRQRERNRYANMTKQQRDERNKKHREAYQRAEFTLPTMSKGCCKPQAGDVAGHKCMIDFNEKLSDTPTFPAKTSSWVISSDEKKEAKRRRERARYANMTHEEKKYRFDRQYLQEALRRKTQSQEHVEARKERRRVHNMTPEQKQARRDREKACRMVRRKTLHKESIAMENPMYNSSDESI